MLLALPFLTCTTEPKVMLMVVVVDVLGSVWNPHWETSAGAVFIM